MYQYRKTANDVIDESDIISRIKKDIKGFGSDLILLGQEMEDKLYGTIQQLRKDGGFGDTVDKQKLAIAICKEMGFDSTDKTAMTIANALVSGWFQT